MTPTQPGNRSRRRWHWAAAAFLILISALLVQQAVNSAHLQKDAAVAPLTAGPQNNGVAKLRVEREGLYELGEAEFRRLGILLEQVESSNLRISWRGIPIPAWIEEDAAGKRLRFFASRPSSLYSQEDYYWLQWGAQASEWPEQAAGDIEQNAPFSQDLSTVPSVTSKVENTVLSELRLEQQSLYSPQVESGDRFMWKIIAAPATEDFSFDLTNLGGNSSDLAELVIDVWASTEARVEPDHAMEVYVNGEKIANMTWDGRGRQSFSVQFPARALKAGANTIRIALPGIPDVAADIVHLDRMSLYYPTRLARQQGQAIFWGTGSRLAPSELGSKVSLLDISNPLSSTLLSGQTSVDSYDLEAGKRYLAVWEGGAYTPAGIEQPQLAPNLRDPSLAAEYVAIGPAYLLPPLEPLMALRQEQGLSTAMVDVQLIYDQFGFGYPEPQAIQHFLRYANEQWAKPEIGEPLRFVLLVGDSTYDPRGYLSTEQANRMPTFLVDTVFGGQTATDVDFVQFNDDPWPDAAVGRLPAQNALQLQNYVDKVLRYEQNLSNSSQELSIRAVADGQEASFALDADEFLKLFPEEIPTELFSPSAGAQAANQEVRKIFTSGSSIIAYFGHGSVNMWGKDRLFTVEDVAALEKQEQFPIVLNLTCLTGLFTHPKVESLAEALLWKAEAGAVAVLAPSSLTLPFDQTFLSGPLAQALASETGSTLGEIHLAARRQIPPENRGSRDVMLTFMLFGDPALRLK